MYFKKISLFLLLIIFSISYNKNLSAQELNEFEKKGGELHLVVNNVSTFKVNELSKVAISNPKIVDVVSASLTELTLEPKMKGTTQITYIDREGEHKVYVRVLERDLEALKRGVDKIIKDIGFKEINTEINYEAQKIYLLGEVLSETDKERLKNALYPLQNDIIDMVVTHDQKIAVEIDVEAVELSKSDVDHLGIKWNLYPFTTVTEYPFSGTPNPDKMAHVSRRLAEGFRIGYTSRAGENNEGIKADINLLVQKGKAKVLSRPKLVCLSGKEAEFLVGGEIPIVTISTSGEGGTQSPNVEYKPYGITLKIKPKIRQNNEIELEVFTEVKDIDETRGVSTDVVEAPAFTTRNAQTNLYLKENEIVFLAGLISNKQRATTQGVPFLSKVPLVGWFFKNKDTTDDQIELIISLTPRIIQISSGEMLGMSQQEEVKAQTMLKPEPDPVLEYARRVQEIISGVIKLAPEDEDARLVITLVIASDGTVKKAVLKEASGIKDIDDTVMYAVNNKSLFPAFPPQLRQNEISLNIPIIFKKTNQS
ncbi:MAG: TonB C-terminal domain-containing protein [Candidatus Omnitrophica bacterium]|nr:TonB C-terminal domain-containing protein [Candidatus Omnitrophota bacterium]